MKHLVSLTAWVLLAFVAGCVAHLFAEANMNVAIVAGMVAGSFWRSVFEW